MSRITKRDTPTPADLDPALMSAAPALRITLRFCSCYREFPTLEVVPLL